jgi:hypothetical protein
MAGKLVPRVTPSATASVHPTTPVCPTLPLPSLSPVRDISPASSLLCSPPELRRIKNSNYRPIPDDSTVGGIELETFPMYVCDCGHGYQTFETLRTHQTRKDKRQCLLRLLDPKSHMGYAQRLTAN